MIKEKQYEIQVKEFEVKLKKKYFKILYLFPAINDTFVFLGMYLPGSEMLVHCDKNGNILYEHKFSHSVDSLGMVELNQAIVLETRANQMTVFNLQTHIKTAIPFQFMFEESDQSEIITFSESKYICITEKGRYNDNRFRLSYFKNPLNEDSQPLTTYESDSEWTYEYLVRKGNQQSMVIWFKSRHDEQFQLKEFHLQNVNPKFNHFATPNIIGVPYGKQKLQVALTSAWQFSKNQFCLICIIERIDSKSEKQDKSINNNFIWDTTSNQIREAKFFIDEQFSQCLIDNYNLGKYSVFHTFSYHNGKVEFSPIYYVDHKEEKLIKTCQRQWTCTYRTKIEFPSHETSLYLQNQYQNAEVDRFKMKIIKLIQKQN